ncbi:hypothetical protein CcrC1_gp087 [Caulobacter phage C1]|nr:hypothetical protein CcrC1_gp087 [Caulobacter phage C1]UTU08315.1 hypothetical protein CcrC2_gp087 [Caulobacter phage C2]UTU08836.1 hypothetical protein CcrJ4_gp085 [Caulobacter phage J4]UTU09389.1 hypothetical protein CcrBL47_gp103 [Caulobacter phage BL47]UTU09949.1 hypothetical protein CcrRB23_gp087 [Caulobacter phage RB23]WGN96974.1 hypothetical protein [Bertelyvirus sp.]
MTLPDPTNVGQMQITAALEGYNPNDHYPPKGTPNTCLILALTCDNFTVLGHTGRYLHAMINCAGFNGEELGLENVPDEPGYWVCENGDVNAGTDSFTGEGYAEMYGDWRRARLSDFARFEVDMPLDLSEA